MYDFNQQDEPSLEEKSKFVISGFDYFLVTNNVLELFSH
jgi:hypothetical protein